MATVHDVAAYVLSKLSPMSAMKLQKLVYYCQAWSLVWDDAPLFPEKIEAWANGPVVRELYERHRGQFALVRWDGNPDALTAPQKETVDSVLRFYGDKSPQWLSDLTHMERPWKVARGALADGERGDQEITLESMAEYYSSLPPHDPPA
jgi:uncharacterized phage-associated protein